MTNKSTGVLDPIVSQFGGAVTGSAEGEKEKKASAISSEEFYDHLTKMAAFSAVRIDGAATPQL